MDGVRDGGVVYNKLKGLLICGRDGDDVCVCGYGVCVGVFDVFEGWVVLVYFYGGVVYWLVDLGDVVGGGDLELGVEGVVCCEGGWGDRFVDDGGVVERIGVVGVGGDCFCGGRVCGGCVGVLKDYGWVVGCFVVGGWGEGGVELVVGYGLVGVDDDVVFLVDVNVEVCYCDGCDRDYVGGDDGEGMFY